MDVDSIRRHCLSFPHTMETLQWGEVLCFKVEGKIFATLNLDLEAETRLAFKCDPEHFAELLENEGVRPAPYLGRYKWIALEWLDALPERQIADLIGRSYDMVFAKAKPRKQHSRSNPRRMN